MRRFFRPQNLTNQLSNQLWITEVERKQKVKNLKSHKDAATLEFIC